MSGECKSPTASSACAAKDKLMRRYMRLGGFTDGGGRVVSSIERTLQDLTDAYAVYRRAQQDPSASRTSVKLAMNKARDCYDELMRKCESLGEYDKAQIALMDRTRSSVEELKAAARSMMSKFSAGEASLARRPSSRDHSPRRDYSPRPRNYSPSRSR